MIERNTNIPLSVIVPVGARHEDIGQLYREYCRGLDLLRTPYEFVFVVDGMYRDVIQGLETLINSGATNLTMVVLNRSFGESTAIMAGFERCSGELILTLPAYHQINPEDISKLVGALERKDVAVGWRWPRAGGMFERLRRSMFHGLVSRVTGMRLHD